MTASTVPTAPTVRDNASVTAADRSQVFHSWTAQGALNPVPIADGLGAEAGDVDGTR
ncbi:hypothetical protein [Rathayibacter iranicus]|nr:hypothetical protein [Rathayibacter iranicus]MWV30124.1 hypothetical protein [Rathayibacter iranicus NCPPB 2253 = VKM Ac-1602]